MKNSVDICLMENEMPGKWFNFVHSLPRPLPEVKNHETEVCSTQTTLMQKIKPQELLEQDHCREEWITIPEEIHENLFRIGRPTPLRRAVNLERYLDTPAHIYLKREDTLVTGSFKLTTAIVQAYYAKRNGFKGVVSETGAGQWGMALALSAKLYGLQCRIFMAKCSLEQKPYKEVYMKLLNAEVLPSPSDSTEIGRGILKSRLNHPGTIGTAISEAIAYALGESGWAYLAGSNTTHVLIHQTLLGLEVKRQMEKIGEKPDELYACVSGGSNLGGFMLPFLKERMKHEIRYIGAESTAAPRLTKGKYDYDYSDYKGYTAMTKSYTMGHDFIPDPVHVGGLRQHNGSPIIGLLRNEGLLEAEAFHEAEAFRAAKLFLEQEGILIAPETSHAAASIIKAAREAKEKGCRKNMVMLCSGSGMLDLEGYQSVLL